MYRAGYRTGLELDPDRLHWNGDGPRPLAWSAWYPTHDQGAVRCNDGLFALGDLVTDGSLAPDRPFPVVLLSHGTGGSPESLGWLAACLARQGYVVIGAHHHGNTGREPYLAEGFLCWWERAADFRALLPQLARTGPFADRLDLSEVHAIGFSLGAHTALTLAGARSDMARFTDWAAAAKITMTGPREFPGVAHQIPHLMDTSMTFRRSWARQGEAYRLHGLKSVVAIAAAPPVRAFDPASIQAIDMPVLLITGEADQEAPTSQCSAWLTQTNPAFTHKSAGGDVGHYAFLGLPSGTFQDEEAFLFTDTPGVDRAEVHRMVIEAFKGLS